MTARSVARSTFATNLARYIRSWGLWLLLLAGPVGARFMIARDDGSGVQIAIGQHLPVMTSAMLGISLGIVVSTLLLPIGFLYLRSNVTRQQPWQVQDVTGASTVAVAFGRFAADVSILLGMLASLTVAGWFLGWLIVSGPLDIVEITWTLWLIAAPALMGLAALALLLEALPVGRRAWGDLIFLIIWFASIATPAAVSDRPSSFASNMMDFAGFVRPLVGAAPSGGHDFSIGSTSGILPGRTPLDVIAGVHASGYIESRLTWVVIAFAITAISGVLYRPRTQRRRSRFREPIQRKFAAGPPAPAVRNAPAALAHAQPFIGLVVSEFRLIAAGRVFFPVATIAACAGLIGDYRHIGSPAALLLLVFGLSAHAGRSEATGLLSLTNTATLTPWMRRCAFLLAGTAWALAMAIPAAAIGLSTAPLVLNLLAGVIAATLALTLARISQGAFAPRVVLLVLWYGYLSS